MRQEGRANGPPFAFKEPSVPQPRVIIAAEHASLRFGGEAALPLHHFLGLRRRGVESWLVVHERTRQELTDLLGADLGRVTFLPDTALNRICWRLGRMLPARLGYFTFGMLSRIATQIRARRAIRGLVRRHGATVVHQPIPVSPREPSLLHDLGVPVVIGPMNGNMDWPPAFRRQRRGGALLDRLRPLAGIAHRLMPGKRRAALLLVANARTAAGLPAGSAGRVRELVENGIDLALWTPMPPRSGAAHFLFMGRLVDWKAVDIALLALARLPQSDASLTVIGDGPMRPALEALAVRLGLTGRVHFAGWLSQNECAARLAEADALLLPSLFECGGAVVLEAMACARPVIATDWGGPADYLTPECGFLIAPDSHGALVAGFAAAMQQLAEDPVLRARLGAAARARAVAQFGWEDKITTMLGVYHDAAQRPPGG